MRITDGMVADQFLYDANASLNRYTKLYQQQTSTKKISNIADDPIATASALQARSKLSSLANYQDSVTYATNTMAESSNAAESLNEVVKSAYQLISSANSGSKTDSDYSAIAEEIAGLRDEVVSIGNSTMWQKTGDFLPITPKNIQKRIILKGRDSFLQNSLKQLKF